MEFCLVALYKAPGVIPVKIGDIIHCLLIKCVLLLTCATETEACVNLNLCARLVAGIDSAVNSTMSKYSKDQCPLVEYQALLVGGFDRLKVLRGAGQVEGEE